MTTPQPPPTPHELARATWRKATASGGSQGCVEVARLPDWTVIRDSKNPDGPACHIAHHHWAQFLSAVKTGRFDLP